MWFGFSMLSAKVPCRTFAGTAKGPASRIPGF
jgi:hypothetical protein